MHALSNPIQDKLSKIKLRSSKAHSVSEKTFQTEMTPLKVEPWGEQ